VPQKDPKQPDVKMIATVLAKVEPQIQMLRCIDREVLLRELVSKYAPQTGRTGSSDLYGDMQQ
jgi:hypothetical protein